MGKQDFQHVNNKGGHLYPFLDHKILEDGDSVECLWPDGSITHHKLRVTCQDIHIEHPGRYPGDGWIEQTVRYYAYIDLEHKGVEISILLGKDSPKVRRIKS